MTMWVFCGHEPNEVFFFKFENAVFTNRFSYFLQNSGSEEGKFKVSS